MKDDFVIQRRKQVKGTLYLFLDTDKTIFKGLKWNQLGEWGKRKAENFMVLSRWHDKKDYIKVVYV